MHDDPRRTNSAGGGRLLALIFAAILGITAFLGYHGDLARWPFHRDPPTASLLGPPLPPLDNALVSRLVDPVLANITAGIRPYGLGAAGSGIVLTADGQVLTSHHVIKGADTVTVSDIGTGAVYPATVLGYDSAADIALIELTGADGLPVARIGSSAGLRLGDQLLAIGNAGGTGSPTAVGGAVTDLDSTIVARNAADLSRKSLHGLIAVAAAVAAGQSGGALVDRYGAVVGVVTAASGDLQKAMGQGPKAMRCRSTPPWPWYAKSVPAHRRTPCTSARPPPSAFSPPTPSPPGRASMWPSTGNPRTRPGSPRAR